MAIGLSSILTTGGVYRASSLRDVFIVVVVVIAVVHYEGGYDRGEAGIPLAQI